MARLAGKMRGDLRALEEQRNSPRTNPVRGAGATPSMGLSQYRGGMSGCGDSESDEELEGGALERSSSGPAPNAREKYYFFHRETPRHIIYYLAKISPRTTERACAFPSE